MTDKVVKLVKTKPKKAVAAVSSRADYVKDRIREAIQAGRYQPGERIRETEVAVKHYVDLNQTGY